LYKGLIDVLEGSYGGDISKMPYVVNKEAFASARLRREFTFGRQSLCSVSGYNPAQ